MSFGPRISCNFYCAPHSRFFSVNSEADSIFFFYFSSVIQQLALRKYKLKNEELLMCDFYNDGWILGIGLIFMFDLGVL